MILKAGKDGATVRIRRQRKLQYTPKRDFDAHSKKYQNASVRQQDSSGLRWTPPHIYTRAAHSVSSCLFSNSYTPHFHGVYELKFENFAVIPACRRG